MRKTHRKSWLKPFVFLVFLVALLAPATTAVLELPVLAVAPGRLLPMPYLQAVTTDSIYVLVERDSKNPVTVEYGMDTSYGNTAVTESVEATTSEPATYVHNVKLTGLKPDTLYHYRVRQDGHSGAQQGGYSPDHTFTTAAEPGASFRFAWAADFRTGTSIHDAIAKRIKAANPRFLLYGGDLCLDGSYAAFKNEFFRPAEMALISEAPFFNATGNHEGWLQNTRAFTQAPAPNPDLRVPVSGTPASNSGDRGYYSFDYGDVHILVLNNQIPYTIGSPQYNFAKSDLESAKKTWKIVVAHRHAYAAGGHGEDEGMKAMAAGIFEPNKVDMVIAGHSHFYQHNLVRGIHYLVIGSVGAPLYDPGAASYTLKSVKDYNYAVVDVTPTTLHMAVYNDRGMELDSIYLAKQDPIDFAKLGARPDPR